MVALGPNLGEPHTKAFGEGLFELRLKGAEGIARVFFCTLVGRRIVMLHSFIKKSQKTPPRERRIAEARMKEIKVENA
jgi:phage-related protein